MEETFSPCFMCLFFSRFPHKYEYSGKGELCCIAFYRAIKWNEKKKSIHHCNILPTVSQKQWFCCLRNSLPSALSYVHHWDIITGTYLQHPEVTLVLIPEKKKIIIILTKKYILSEHYRAVKKFRFYFSLPNFSLLILPLCNWYRQ